MSALTRRQTLIAFSNEKNNRKDKSIIRLKKFYEKQGKTFNSNDDVYNFLAITKTKEENEANLRRREQKEAERNEMRRRAEKSTERKEIRKENRRERQAKALKIYNSEGNYTYKGTLGSNRQLGEQVGVNIKIPLIEANKQEIASIIRKLHRRVPEGYNFSLRVQGTRERGPTEMVRQQNPQEFTNEIIRNPQNPFSKSSVRAKQSGEKSFKSRNEAKGKNEFSNDINRTLHISKVSTNVKQATREFFTAMDKITGSSSYNQAEGSNISLFYEVGQGGSHYSLQKSGELFNLLEGKFKIYSPTRKNSCAKICLSLFGVDCPEGFQSFAYVKALAKNITEVFDSVNDVNGNNCILLFKNHFYKLTRIEQEKTKSTKKTTKKQDANDKTEKIETDEKDETTLVFDIESYRMELNREDKNISLQKPIALGYSLDGEKFDYFYGNDCPAEFVKYLIENKKIKYVIGYNSGNYDTILIRNELIKYGFALEECRRSANSILRLTAKIDERKIIFVDLINFTTGTLRANLESLKFEVQKGDINYDMIGVDKTPEFKAELLKYLESDVIGTFKLYEALNLPWIKRGLDLRELYTHSQGAYKILKDYWKAEKTVGNRVKVWLDKFARNACYGGRCEVFKRKFKSSQYLDILARKVKFEDIHDHLTVLDVVSLYPSAMQSNFFPIGPVKQSKKLMFHEDELNEAKDGILPDHLLKMGIYNCTIKKPKNLRIPVVFDKVFKSYNLNDCTGTFTTIDILQMLKYDYEVKINEGVYWDDSAKIFESYMEEFFKVKQEAKKNKDGPTYLNAKLSLNAVYGKTLQNDEHKTHYVISNKEDLVNMYKGKEMNKFSMEWDFTDGNEIGYYTYTEEKKEEDLTDKKAYIGAFVLSYSKQKMFNELVKLDTLHYTDTDSLYFHSSELHKIKQGSNIGEFEDELDGGKIINAYFPAKKLKYIEYITPNGEIKIKISGKGCDKDRIIISDFEEMHNGNKVKNVRPFKMKRNLKDGEIKFIKNDEKTIKQNDGNRIFIGNESYPIGYDFEKYPIKTEEIKIQTETKAEKLKIFQDLEDYHNNRKI